MRQKITLNRRRRGRARGSSLKGKPHGPSSGNEHNDYKMQILAYGTQQSRLTCTGIAGRGIDPHNRTSAVSKPNSLYEELRTILLIYNPLAIWHLVSDKYACYLVFK